jgi:hypothetical protein
VYVRAHVCVCARARVCEVEWSGFTWLRTRTICGSCQCGDEPLGSAAMELVSYVNNGAFFVSVFINISKIF